MRLVSELLPAKINDSVVDNHSSVNDRPLTKGKATFELADFFKYSSNEGFDLVYDYT